MTTQEFQEKVAADRQPRVQPTSTWSRRLPPPNVRSHVSSTQLDLAIDIFMSRLELITQGY